MTTQPLPDLDVNVNGEAPELAGKACEAVLLQQYWYAGALVDPANVIHLKSGGEWYRLYFDYGIVFGRISEQPPEPWLDADQQWDNPLCDLGVTAGIVGTQLDHYSMELVQGGSAVELCFKDGRCVVFKNIDDHTTYDVI